MDPFRSTAIARCDDSKCAICAFHSADEPPMPWTKTSGGSPAPRETCKIVLGCFQIGAPAPKGSCICCPAQRPPAARPRTMRRQSAPCKGAAAPGRRNCMRASGAPRVYRLGLRNATFAKMTAEKRRAQTMPK
jgi:hypothetical protein